MKKQYSKKVSFPNSRYMFAIYQLEGGADLVCQEMYKSHEGLQ